MVTEQRLMRSSNDKVIAGVCGGIAQYFGLDPVIVRLIMVALVFAGGVSILLYPVLWLVMPVAGAGQTSFGDNLQDLQRQAQAFGQQASQQVQSAFSTPRFDPQTGQPLVDPTRRNRTLGLVLLGIGTLMLASAIPYLGQVLIPLMIVGGGVYLLRRNS